MLVYVAKAYSSDNIIKDHLLVAIRLRKVHSTVVSFGLPMQMRDDTHCADEIWPDFIDFHFAQVG